MLAGMLAAVARLPACVLHEVRSSKARKQGSLLKRAIACHSRGVWCSRSATFTHVRAAHSELALQGKSCTASVPHGEQGH